MGAVSGEEVEEVLDELSWLVLVKQVTGVNRDESGICELLDEFGQVLLGHKAAWPPADDQSGCVDARDHVCPRRRRIVDLRSHLLDDSPVECERPLRSVGRRGDAGMRHAHVLEHQGSHEVRDRGRHLAGHQTPERVTD